MNRIVVILLLALSVGCATTRSETVNGRSLDQQLDYYIDEFYDQVVDQCFEIHGKAVSGQSGIDCSVRGNAMHLSFPSIPIHNLDAVYEGTRSMEANWCSAAQSKTGKVAHWVLHFRKERRAMSKPCFKGEQLRQLLRASKRYSRTP